jgi:hypothetical protein
LIIQRNKSARPRGNAPAGSKNRTPSKWSDTGPL